ncbi:hypothetical protein Tco_0508981 [Tanacetum coccineum]
MIYESLRVASLCLLCQGAYDLRTSRDQAYRTNVDCRLLEFSSSVAGQSVFNIGTLCGEYIDQITAVSVVGAISEIIYTVEKVSPRSELLAAFMTAKLIDHCSVELKAGILSCDTKRCRNFSILLDRARSLTVQESLDLRHWRLVLFMTCCVAEELLPAPYTQSKNYNYNPGIMSVMEETVEEYVVKEWMEAGVYGSTDTIHKYLKQCIDSVARVKSQLAF